MNLKISIITPSFNSGASIEKAINSVLDQNYTNYEHIVIDGGSTDGTIDILRKYPHLIWVSEKDRGQVDAMNKGFRKSTGDIIVYLNADDYFLCGAFSSVIPYFEQGHKFVVGDIVVQKSEEYYINVPTTKLWQMIRHWELNAFPYNPVGYFYIREVQEVVPFDEKFVCMMDLRFLMEAASKFEFKKLNCLLGVYRCIEDTKTVCDQKNLNYWTRENFSFIDKYVAMMPADYQKTYEQDRERGYQQQRQWQLDALVKSSEKSGENGLTGSLLGRVKGVFSRTCSISGAGPESDRKGVLTLPATTAVRGELDDKRYLLKEGDSAMLIYQMGKVGSSSIYKALKDQKLPWPIYHVHYLSEKRLQEAVYWHEHNDFKYLPEHVVVARALRAFLQQHEAGIKWKIISLVRDPAALQASVIFQNLKEAFSCVIDNESGRVMQEKAHKLVIEELEQFATRDSHFINWFDYELKTVFGVDIYEYPFDKQKGYTVIERGNVKVLLLKFEQMNECFTEAMDVFLGIKGVSLPKVNVGDKKQFGDDYKEVIQKMSLPSDLCSRLYSHKFVTHFYTDREIERFRQRWTG